MAGSNLGIGLGERGLSLFPARPGGTAGMHVVTGLTPNLTGAATRESNRAAIQNAINTVGAAGGGVVFIPAGHYYLQQADTTREQAAININHNNITLRGAGIGRTVLHTRSDYSLQSGRVIRGHGIRVVGTGSASSPRLNIVLEGFELDGDAGWTGNYNWPANPTTGDGWDITHKGIVPSWDDHVDHVTIRDVYVHSYRGEILYVGGWNLNNLVIERVWSRDGNASALNTFADNMQVYDCQFGGPNMFLQEWAQTNMVSTVVIENCTFCQVMHQTGAVGISDMTGAQSATWRDNRFIDFAHAAFGYYGGVGSTIDTLIEGNYFEDLGVSPIYLTNHVGGPPVDNITFQNNRIIGSPWMVITWGGEYENHMYRGNDFSGNGGNTMFYYGGGSWTGVTVSNNIYRNTGSEVVDASADPTNPTFTGNNAGAALNDTQAPSVPTHLTATVGAPLAGVHRVWLTWTASTDNIGVSGYRVYRNNVRVGTARHRWFMDEGLSGGTQHTYEVAAFDFAGNESERSTAVLAVTS